MTDQSQALLFVYGEPGEFVSEDRFNAWYDREHLPARTTVPGFSNARRYKAVDSKLPTWLALYDMTSAEVMQSQPYQDLRLRVSENEKEVVANLSLLDRRVYTRLSSEGQSELGSTNARFVYVVHMQVDGDENAITKAEHHFLKWYKETRIPLISNVPGWLRSRVYQLKEHAELAGRADKASPLAKKAPLKFLALHEWSTDGSEVFELPEFRACMTAEEPWAMVGESTVAEIEDRRFGLHRASNAK